MRLISEANECITYDHTISNLNGYKYNNSFNNVKVSTPHCINDIIEEKSGGKSIEGVYLGHHNTKVILVDM